MNQELNNLMSSELLILYQINRLAEVNQLDEFFDRSLTPGPRTYISTLKDHSKVGSSQPAGIGLVRSQKAGDLSAKDNTDIRFVL